MNDETQMQIGVFPAMLEPARETAAVLQADNSLRELEVKGRAGLWVARAADVPPDQVQFSFDLNGEQFATFEKEQE